MIRPQVAALVALGPFPGHDEPDAVVDPLMALAEPLLDALDELRPATDAEAEALVRSSFARETDDSLYGVLYTVLHFVETAPGWPIESVLFDSALAAFPWVRQLIQRAENGERLDIRRPLLPIDGTGDPLDVTLRVDESGEDTRVIAEAAHPVGTHEAAGTTLFEALVQLRLTLEAEGWLLGVVGAQRDVYPFPKLYPRGGGWEAYTLKLGKQARETDLVWIMDPVHDATVVTVTEQLRAYEQWVASLGADVDEPPAVEAPPAHDAPDRPATVDLAFAGYVHAFVADALATVPADTAADVYVVSLQVKDIDGDPRQPTVTVGYNTEAKVSEQSAHATPEETRWNFALWLQNKLAILAHPDESPASAERLQTWLRTIGLADLDELDELAFTISGHLDELLQAVVTRLHTDGDITRVFGRPIPVLIHELVYYEKIAAQNERCNPDGLAAPFAAWVRRES